MDNVHIISPDSLIEIGPELLWLAGPQRHGATAVFANADTEARKRTLTADELALLCAIDGTRCKAQIAQSLDLTSAQFDALFMPLARFAPGALGWRNPDPVAASQRHRSHSAAAELRDIWAAMTAAQEANAAFHSTDITAPDLQFDAVETTISHMFRAPTEALQGKTYAESFGQWLLNAGWLTPEMKIIEFGCGLGYFAAGFLDTLSRERPDLYATVSLTLFDLSPQLAEAQKANCARHLDKITFLHGNMETYDFGAKRYDLAISNEVIADLSVEAFEPGETTTAAELAKHYDLELAQVQLGGQRRSVLNTGAIRFIETLGACLTSRGRAIITEYGTLDGIPKGVKFRNHYEYTVQFSHLSAAARKIGFHAGLENLGELLGFDPHSEVLDARSYSALNDGIAPLLGLPPLPKLAYSRSRLRDLLGPKCDHVGNLQFHALSDPAAFSPFRFFALTLARTLPAVDSGKSE